MKECNGGVVAALMLACGGSSALASTVFVSSVAAITVFGVVGLVAGAGLVGLGMYLYYKKSTK